MAQDHSTPPRESPHRGLQPRDRARPRNIRCVIFFVCWNRRPAMEGSGRTIYCRWAVHVAPPQARIRNKPHMFMSCVSRRACLRAIARSKGHGKLNMVKSLMLVLIKGTHRLSLQSLRMYRRRELNASRTGCILGCFGFFCNKTTVS